MNLTKIHSITKKILVAFLGGFLLLFILFHASANLLILREDDGAWYSAFCHFMGTNYIVKVFELLLFLTLIFHIIITLWLAYTNYKARGTVRYHERSRTKTHSGSKLMAWTGALILCLLVVHFFHFYFVKMDIVEGQYMVEQKEFNEQAVKNPQVQSVLQMAQMFKASPAEIAKQDSSMTQLVPFFAFVDKVYTSNMLSEDGKWIKGIT
ncbi:MAG: hypothetical protein IJ620_04855, partial [Bacteroidales bacterium]|nr:hypothetical protein [Bacteroidales bacterium]